ncbi:MAG: type I restriction-modification system subunit M N-terminal domain-containing protein, partial [Pseudomonadota bacterium]
MTHHALTTSIWAIADILRGDYKQSDYGKVILPLTILRWIDCKLVSIKNKLLDKSTSDENIEKTLAQLLGRSVAPVGQVKFLHPWPGQIPPG